MSEFSVPRIDDTVELNQETLRITGISTWDDTDEEDGVEVIILMITLVKSRPVIPSAFGDAFKESDRPDDH